MKKQSIKKFADELSFPVKADKFPELVQYCKEHKIVLLCEVINIPENQEAEFYKYLYESGMLADSDLLSEASND
jgi:hypothetical protein